MIHLKFKSKSKEEEKELVYEKDEKPIESVVLIVKERNCLRSECSTILSDSDNSSNKKTKKWSIKINGDQVTSR